MSMLSAMFGAPATMENAGDIEVKSVPESKPQFKREYKVRLDGRAVLTVTARTLYGRIFSGTLTQPNGNSVWFDPDRVAEKILDPTLVPLVEMRIQQVREIDRAFLQSKPSLFVDETGTKWAKVS